MDLKAIAIFLGPMAAKYGKKALKGMLEDEGGSVDQKLELLAQHQVFIAATLRRQLMYMTLLLVLILVAATATAGRVFGIW